MIQATRLLDEPAPAGASAEHTCGVAPISHAIAEAFVRDYHYMGTLPKSVQTNFGWFVDGTLVACACYGPVHSARAPAGWLELRRLVRHPLHEIQLSQFLAATLRALKHQGVPAVLSWADPAADHHGGIYQATNWVYTEPYSYNWNYSFRKPDGTVINHRQAFAKYGTSSKAKILAMEPDWVPFLPPMKLRYLMPLRARKNKALRALRATERPYPKPHQCGQQHQRIPASRRREFKATGRS